ncbi:hypothetical protein LTR84_012693 [Exophiala bonariae]|uniref:Exonuclease domain-containing protein n=1 Tax=Exophiala bonariae TaxID=1690606 RepID=A0AAV9NEQ1_9EURO|nr:hypothetical protein LTR84_012693 [Exophiala bonariae]
MVENGGIKRSAAQAGLSATHFRYPEEQPLQHKNSHTPSAPAQNGERHSTGEMDMEISEHENDQSEAPDQLDGQWSVAESKSARKKRKTANKAASKAKKNYDGPPGVSFLPGRPDQVQVKALQELVLYILSDSVAPTWLAVNNAKQIQKVVVLMIPGLDKNSLKQSDLFKSSMRSEHDHIGESAPTESGPVALAEVESAATTLPTLQSDETPARTCPSLSENPASSLLDHLLQVKAPGDSGRNQIHSPLQTMLISPYSEPKNKKGNHEKPQTTRTAIGEFIHTADELREAEYPIHPATFDNQRDAQLEDERREKTLQSASAGWVDTNASRSEFPVPVTAVKSFNPLRDLNSLKQGYNVYALDCEMVLTDDDKYSLARISIIDWYGRTVLDKYVLPSLPIKNYFTQFSGITEKILENVTTTLQDIQKELLTLLGSNSILLGHSLESDLNALKLTHPHIIDTSIIYPHPRGLPLRSSLKYLANKYLKREIQKGGADGHDSVEDARAVLDLVKLKCEKGAKWGTMDANGESIFRRISKAARADGSPRQTAIVEYGTPERGLGKEATYKIACEDDDDIVNGILHAAHGDEISDGNNGTENDGEEDNTIENSKPDVHSTTKEEPANEEGQSVDRIPAGGVDFIWGRLRDLEAIRGWNAPPDPIPDDLTPEDLTYDPKTPETTSPDPALEIAMTQTLTRLAKVYTSLPEKTLLIVFNGTGDMRPFLKLQQLFSQYKREFKIKKWDELSVKWTDVEEQALKRATNAARRGWAAIAVR